MSFQQIDVDRSALLVIDMQNAFCHVEGTLGISGVDVTPAQATYAPIRRLAQNFAAAGRPVIWSRQVHLEKDAARDRKALAPHTARRKRVSALSGSWDAQFVDELADLPTDPTFVVTKHRFGCFYETRLQALLDMLGVSALFVVGVTANACVETTLREAYLRDYDVVAVTDGIASVRPNWLETAHAVWQQYLGVLATSDEVCAWLEQRADEPAIDQLHHLLLEVADLGRSLDFYVDVLGFRVRKREPFRGDRELVVTEHGLGMTTGLDGNRQGLEHLCFTVRGVDELARRAEKAGHRLVRGPGPGPYGHTVYIEDPDGNEVELVEPGPALTQPVPAESA